MSVQKSVLISVSQYCLFWIFFVVNQSQMFVESKMETVKVLNAWELYMLRYRYFFFFPEVDLWHSAYILPVSTILWKVLNTYGDSDI